MRRLRIQRKRVITPVAPQAEQRLFARLPQENAATETDEMAEPTAIAETTPNHDFDFSQVSVQPQDQATDQAPDQPQDQPQDRLGTDLELNGTVGKNGENAPEDVAKVQTRLSLLGFDCGEMDGKYSNQITDAIQKFQEFFMKEPDGLIEVNSSSHKRLSQLQSATEAQKPKPKNEDSTSIEETEMSAQPEASPFKVKRHREFVQSVDGKSIDSKLMQTLEEFFKYLITHNHVGGDVVLLEGMRDPRKAHRWSTAYAIRNDQIPIEVLKKLSGGRDTDGNQWYKEGENLAETKRRAADLGLNSPSTPAAEGYPKGDSKQLPNEWTDEISNHMIGKAVKVSIPWTTAKQGQLEDPIANDLIKKFGLKRPVPKDETHFELLQGSPKGSEEDAHKDSET